MLASIKRLLSSMAKGGHQDLYGLDHAILNVAVPPATMWMNLGYWKDTNNFPEACQALLETVLVAAGLLIEDKTASTRVLRPGPASFKRNFNQESSRNGGPHHHHQTIQLVDVGLGCGDQSLYLTRQLHRSGSTNTTDGDGNLQPLFDQYIGINITPSQADLARRRLRDTSSQDTNQNVTPDVQIFTADAANPASWDVQLKNAVLGNVPTQEVGDDENESKISTSRPSVSKWLLALDTIYHFNPSRLPILKFAYQNMHASFMAFDLLISDSATFWDKFRLRLMCLVAGMPFSNFLTESQYEDMLVGVGYAREDIHLQDVSQHVFSGIAEFIKTKENELRVYGMTLGKFTAPGKAFGWWAESGVVRGVVVVAHRN